MNLFPDGQRFPMMLLGLGVPTLGTVQHREVVVAIRNVGVVGRKNLFPDGQRFPMMLLGLGVPTLGMVQHREVVVAIRNVGVVGRENPFPNDQLFQKVLLGLRVPTLLITSKAKPIKPPRFAFIVLCHTFFTLDLMNS